LRSARERIGLALIAFQQCINLPQPLSAARVDGVQPTIQRNHVQATVESGDPAIHGIATGITGPLPVDLRVVLPQFLAGRRIERIDAPEITARVHDPVNDEWGRLQAAVRAEPVIPRKAQLGDIGRVDVLERRIVGAIGIPSGSEPLVRIDLRETSSVDGRGLCGR
jgi:hypothetical protein